jgi:hypothetical protein
MEKVAMSLEKIDLDCGIADGLRVGFARAERHTKALRLKRG